MVLSWIVLLALAAVGVMVLGLLVLSVVLIIGERTRVAGIVLLALILLGVPLVGIGLAAFVWVGHPTFQPAPVREIRAPEIRVERLRPPVEFAPAPMPEVPEVPEAVPMDGPTDDELHEHPGQTETDQPSPAEEPQPDTADQPPDAADQQPGTNSGAGRQFPPGAHRRLNT